MPQPILELELYLVRHGQSQTNAGNLKKMDYRRFEDPFLTEKGEEQARRLADFYVRVPLDCVLSSGQNRALQTASEVVRRQHGLKTLEVHPIFTECGLLPEFGEKSFDEIKAAFPSAGTDPAGNFVFTEDDPTDEKHFLRAQEAVNYLRTRFHSGEKVMVAAHAAFNTSMMYAALGLGVGVPFDFSFENTCVSKLMFFQKGTGKYNCDVHLMYHNDRTHLAGPEFRTLWT